MFTQFHRAVVVIAFLAFAWMQYQGRSLFDNMADTHHQSTSRVYHK